MSDTNDKKTIQINPELFKISNNTTRKTRKPRSGSGPIKMKTPPPPKNNSTLKKNLLKMIRNHQQQQKQSSKPIIQEAENNIPIKSDFEQSLQYLQKINEKEENKSPKKLKKVKQQTIRNVIPIHTTEPYKQNIIASMPPAIKIDSMPLPVNEPSIVIHDSKPYGCMKNGKLPTYRMWKNQTQKHLPINAMPKMAKPVIEVRPSSNMLEYEQKLNQKIQDFTKQEQLNSIKLPKQSLLKKPRRQRRILRKTFHLGKSKKYPQVSVLVANKTIRNNTNLKSIGLKQTPMKDVKKYLLKQGFIKVGTTTPNDVLRQMYESAKLLPGEAKNYNSENLLYNYFNNDDDF